MKIKVSSQRIIRGSKISTRCPYCGQNGTFDPFQDLPDLYVPATYNAPEIILGQRKCPNTNCKGHIFIVKNDSSNILHTYPAIHIDFNETGIPKLIKETFSEALTCHAEECYIAAAIMMRRCLEELCQDRRAEGNSLKDRISELRNSVILPDELFQAMNELRLLGNDAAHIEAKVYEEIGKEEVELAIQLTKEILKAIYQLDSLVKKLQSLKEKE